MKNNVATITELTERIRKFSLERDWEQFHAPKNLAMALAAEAGELLEPFLRCENEASRKLCDNPEKHAAVAEELADVLIFALRLADVAGIDPTDAILTKLARNEERYPIEKAKGNSAKYNEL